MFYGFTTALQQISNYPDCHISLIIDMLLTASSRCNMKLKLLVILLRTFYTKALIMCYNFLKSTLYKQIFLKINTHLIIKPQVKPFNMINQEVL